NKAGLKKLLAESVASRKAPAAAAVEQIKAPPKEIVTAAIAGIEVMDLEDAVQLLWKNGIYAESGMGCTGPIVLVNEANGETAKDILHKGGYVGE
ncbi:MAG: glycine reductase, partial [Clostridia bacterium]|nr:glycine reductase [Clostridia bacterium]